MINLFCLVALFMSMFDRLRSPRFLKDTNSSPDSNDTYAKSTETCLDVDHNRWADCAIINFGGWPL